MCIPCIRCIAIIFPPVELSPPLLLLTRFLFPTVPLLSLCFLVYASLLHESPAVVFWWLQQPCSIQYATSHHAPLCSLALTFSPATCQDVPCYWRDIDVPFSPEHWMVTTYSHSWDQFEENGLLTPLCLLLHKYNCICFIFPCRSLILCVRVIFPCVSFSKCFSLQICSQEYYFKRYFSAAGSWCTGRNWFFNWT